MVETFQCILDSRLVKYVSFLQTLLSCLFTALNITFCIVSHQIKYLLTYYS